VQDLLWDLKEMKSAIISIGSVVQVQEANNGGRGSSCKQKGRHWLKGTMYYSYDIVMKEQI
jgi:hypothetical protein